MLYEEIGVEPQSMVDPDVGIYLRNSFGFDRGRLVSKFPRDWVDRVRQQINQLNDENLKIRLRTLINSQKFLNLLVDFDRPNVQKEWLEDALEIHKANPFNAILTAHTNQPPLVYDAQHLQDLVEQSDARVGYMSVKGKKVDELVFELSPFLRLNKYIVLENYSQKLLSDKKSNELFSQIFALWQKFGGREFLVISSLRIRDQSFDHECDLLEKFLTIKNYEGVFKYFALDDAANRLHERYLLGPLSGIELGYGLETSTRDHSWKILNHATHLDVKRRYMDADIRDEYPEYKEFIYKNGVAKRRSILI
jgi:hypothetical protein